MSFIENIKEKNQFPIIFIGSGITQRYFENAPTWEELIIRLWKMIHDESEYVAEYHRRESEGKDDFSINLEIAQLLEGEINTAFYNGNIEIEGINPIAAHKEGINPFKKLISNIFISLEKKEGVEEEVRLFSDMLVKARFIITTNYDDFIEKCFNDKKVKIKVNIGNAGLFVKSNEYGELYKIHGSVRDSKTISLTERDYKNNESKLAIVNAKILSNLTESPIIFLGYSLTDKNVKRLLYDYSQNMPFGIEEAASRIGIVQYTKGKEDVQDVVASVPDLGIHYTEIRTDNYKHIYKEISNIEQGYSPAEISKYEGAFRRIIEVTGPSKGLENVLTSFVDLTTLSDQEIRDKNIVVAFGDSKYIYKIPTYKDYIKEYFSDNMELDTGIALIFLRKIPANYPVPYKKYSLIIDTWKNIPNDLEREIESLEKRKKNFPASMIKSYIAKAKKTLAKKYIDELETAGSIQKILALENVPWNNKLSFILSKIDTLNIDDLKTFIIDNIDFGENKGMSSTIYRKIVMAYSIIVEGV